MTTKDKRNIRKDARRQDAQDREIEAVQSARSAAFKAESLAKLGVASVATAGPWHVEHGEGGRENLVCGADGTTVANVIVPARDHDAVSVNARLLAAAHDLLEQIKALRDQYTAVVNERDETAHDWNGMYQVDAAISKAEGK